MQSAEDEIRTCCDEAVRVAAQFGVKLTYQDDSIRELEKLLEIIAKDYKGKKIKEEDKNSYAVVFGFYLGKLMLDHGLSSHGYQWNIGEQEVSLAKDGSNKMYPITKVNKRILNGACDNVVSFYNVSIAIVEGRLTFSKK